MLIHSDLQTGIVFYGAHAPETSTWSAHPKDSAFWTALCQLLGGVGLRIYQGHTVFVSQPESPFCAVDDRADGFIPGVLIATGSKIERPELANHLLHDLRHAVAAQGQSLSRYDINTEPHLSSGKLDGAWVRDEQGFTVVKGFGFMQGPWFGIYDPKHQLVARLFGRDGHLRRTYYQMDWMAGDTYQAAALTPESVAAFRDCFAQCWAEKTAFPISAYPAPYRTLRQPEAERPVVSFMHGDSISEMLAVESIPLH